MGSRYFAKSESLFQSFPSRAGISTAVVVDGCSYVFDCGMGSIRNYRSHCTWDQLRAIFITHHHSDHIYDLGSYLLTGWQVPGESFSQPIHVYGPAKPPRVPVLHTHGDHLVVPGCCGGDHPMVGTADIVDALINKVFASDVAIRMADEGRSSPNQWVYGHDIEVPAEAKADPVLARHPVMDPFVVYRDAQVVVSAILVDHRLCYPAFGFRIDSKYGSVVISGDTTYSENCIRLAKGADMLLHEVIDLDAILATFPEGPAREGIAVHLEESHTSYEQVGKVAQAAGVSQLILHHIVPNVPGAADIEKMLRAAHRDFSGKVFAAEDNDSFRVGSNINAASLSEVSHSSENVGVCV
ncbi:MBL fold metallo-hydrolase [Pseudomonas sp. ICMP 8385]|nr:MBL fold metallo-hydrolase [Pseudomonas sp. ICMP 8385]